MTEHTYHLTITPSHASAGQRAASVHLARNGAPTATMEVGATTYEICTRVGEMIPKALWEHIVNIVKEGISMEGVPSPVTQVCGQHGKQSRITLLGDQANNLPAKLTSIQENLCKPYDVPGTDITAQVILGPIHEPCTGKEY